MNALELARQAEDRFRAVQEIDQLSERIAWADRQVGRLKSAIDSLVALLGPVGELASEGRSLSAPDLSNAREILEEVDRSRSELREDATRAAPQEMAGHIANLETLIAALSSWSSREW